MTTLSLTTPMLGIPDLQPGQFTNRVYAVSPDVPVAYPRNIVEDIDRAIIAVSKLLGIRSSILAGQIIKETGALRFGNQVQPQQFNFAGLGATNDGSAGAVFISPYEGVLAVGVHHLFYILGSPMNWPSQLQGYATKSPRGAKVIEAGYGGKVKTIGDYTNGRWAWTPSIPLGSLANGYAKGIVEHANAILASPGNPEVNMLMQPGWEKIATEKYGYAGSTFNGKIIVSHVTAPRAGSLSDHGSLGWLSGPDDDRDSPSVHFLMARSGKVYHIVDLDKAPWTNGINFTNFPRGVNPATGKKIYDTTNPYITAQMLANKSPNLITFTIEHESYNGQGLTPAQWASTIELQAWLCQQFNIVPQVGLTLCGHFQIDNVNRPYCPGWTVDQWKSLETGIVNRLRGAGTWTDHAVDEGDDRLLRWYYSIQPIELQGNLGNTTFYQASLDFSELFPNGPVPAKAQAIIGEFVWGWYWPDQGRVFPLHHDHKQYFMTNPSRMQRL